MDRALMTGYELLGLYSRRWVGKEVEVLVERNQEGKISGLSRHYLRVETRGDPRPGEIATLTIKDSVNPFRQRGPMGIGRELILWTTSVHSAGSCKGAGRRISSIAIMMWW